MYGSYFPILNRILLSIVWFGVQAVIGGKMVYICLRSIWMDIDDRIPNTFSPGMGITLAQFVGYIIFNVICCIAIWFRPTQLRLYFHGASVIVTAALFALLGWAVGTTEGFGAILAKSKSELRGSELVWQTLSAIMSVIGSIAAGILNQNDFTRWAKRPSQVVWPQAISFFVSASIVAIIGVFVTAATQERYGKGEALWDPSDLFKAIQDQGGSRARAAAFFLGLAFIIAQLSINAVGNTLASGLDVASLLPKYFNLRRGSYALALLSVAPNPWQQLSSGSTFLRYINLKLTPTYVLSQLMN